MKTLSVLLRSSVLLFRGLLLVSLSPIGSAASADTSESGQVTYTYDATGNVISITASGPPSGVIEVTDKVEVQIGGLRYNRGTRHFYGQITLINTSGSDIPGPVHLVFSELSDFAQLVNADGRYSGWPYLTLPSHAGLPRRARGKVTAEYSLSSQNPPDFTPLVYSGDF